MNYYIWQSIRKFLDLHIRITFAIIILTLLLKPAIASAAFFLAFSQFFCTNPNWQLLFPASRKRLVAAFFIERTAVALITAASIGLAHWVTFLRYGDDGHSADFFKFSIIFTFIISYIRLSRPMASISAAAPAVTVTKLEALKKMNWRALFVLILIPPFMIVIYSLRYELWIYILLLIAFVCFIPQATAYGFRVPSQSLARWLMATRGTVVAVFLLCLMVVAYNTYFVNASYARVSFALDFWGHIPLPLSQQRFHELAKSPNVNSSPLIDATLVKYGSPLDKDEWVERTQKCRSDSCLYFSNDLIPSAASNGEKLERFEVMLKSCLPGRRYDARFQCVGSSLHGSPLNTWLTFLIENHKINEWLLSDVREKQYAALRAITALRGDDKQLKILKDLSVAKDDVVRTLAFQTLENYGKPENKDRLNCLPTATDPICKDAHNTYRF